MFHYLTLLFTILLRKYCLYPNLSPFDNLLITEKHFIPIYLLPIKTPESQPNQLQLSKIYLASIRMNGKKSHSLMSVMDTQR